MNEIERFAEAFQGLERYEEYLLKKAWGVLLILFSILYLIFTASILIIPELILWGNYGKLLQVRTIMSFILTVIFIAYILFKYKSTKRIKEPYEGKLLPGYIHFGLGLFSLILFPVCKIIGSILLSQLLYVLLPSLPSFHHLYILTLIIIDFFGTAFPFIISYYLLKRIVKSGEFRAFFVSGFFLFIATLISHVYWELISFVQYLNYPEIHVIFEFGVYVLFETIYGLYTCVYHFICGLYLIKEATKTLEGEV